MEGTNIGTLVLTLKGDGTQYFHFLNQATSQTKGAGAQIASGLTGIFAATAAAFVAVAATAVKTYATAEQALVNSTANMKGATNDLRNEMEATSIALSNASDSVASVEELNKAFGSLRNNGKDAAQAIKDIAVADRFAIAANIDAAEAANALAKVQNAVGLSSKDASKDAENMKAVSDLVTAASREGATSMQGMADALAAIGPSVRKMSGGMTEGAALIALFTKQGKDAGEAAQSINQIMRTLGQATTTHAKDWAYYGLSVYDASGKLKSMADIFDELKTHMVGLNDEEQRQMLSDLGFQSRFVQNIQLATEMGSSLRDLQGTLSDVGDATSKVADTQMTSFNAQMSHAYNILHNVFVVIGSYLTPVIASLIPYLTAWAGDMNDVNSNAQAAGQVMKGILVPALEMVGAAFMACRLIFKGGELVFAEVYTAALAMATGIVGVFAMTTNAVVNLLNTIITAYNNTIGKLKDNLKVPPIGKEFAASVDEATLKLAKMTVVSQEAANAIAQDMAKDLREGGKALDDFGDKMLSTEVGFKSTSEHLISGSKGIASAITAVGTAQAEANAGAVEFKEMLKDLGVGFDVDTDKINKYVIALTSGKATMSQFEDALDKMNPTNKKVEDPYTQKNKELQQGMRQEQALYSAAHAALLADAHHTNAQLEALEKQHNQNMKGYTTALTEVQVGAAHNIADSVLSITGNMFSQKSGIYKAMFAVDKAFAIAEATIDMGQAIANAGTLPYPANLGAMATIAADMATIISNISSVAASFEGGGMTPDGPRIGGIDGRGGFMAVLHPNEKITDMTRGSQNEKGGGGSGGDTNVTIHNYAAAAGYTAQSQPGANGSLDIIIQKATEGMANGLRQGGTPLAAALEQTYKLKRGT